MIIHSVCHFVILSLWISAIIYREEKKKKEKKKR